MNTLNEILPGVRVVRLAGDLSVAVSGLAQDSRTCESGSLFIAIRGTRIDGHTYIHQAISLGANAVVLETWPEKTYAGVSYVQVENTSVALGLIASRFYGNPSQELKLVGITGTNGKTTTATLLYRLLEESGIKSGLISTIAYRISGEELESTHTTPDAIALNRLLRRMVDLGCQYCFMEVSSHSIVQHRIAGLTFSGGVFTNITHEHLDYHQTFDRYIAAKKGFFDQLSPEAFALVNRDDKHGKVMLQNCGASHFSYGLFSVADFRAKILENSGQGLHLIIDRKDAWFQLIGRFNAYNILAAYATGVLLGLDSMAVLAGLSLLPPVDGRFNYLTSADGVTAIVDYAHTPDALLNVLTTVNEIRTGGGNLITVVGAGGNRDTAKRPVMARLACQHSNRVILTSDNPRDEDPMGILEEMKSGVPAEMSHQLLTIPDRREAIKTAVALAQPGDYILVAGKGHERYQEIKGVRFPFDDRAVLDDLFSHKPMTPKS